MRLGVISLPQLRQKVMAGGLMALLYMVLIGTKPLSSKVKTIPLTGDGDATRQLWYSLVFIGILWALAPLRDPQRLRVFPATLLLFLIWCWLSVTWSIEPGIALRRLALTTIIAFSIFASVRDLGYDRVIAITRIMLVFNLFMNYLAIEITPVAVHGYMENDPAIVGDWRGVMAQKNFAGAVSVLTIFLFLFDARHIRWWLRIAVLAAAAFFLYKTHSKTSQGLLAACGFAGMCFAVYSPRYRTMAIPILAIVACAIFWLIYTYSTEIDAFMTDPASLTGRVQIWPVLISYANDHWLLGTGFGNFWNVGPRSPAYAYGEGWAIAMGNGHNGYLDLLSQLGYPGLALAIIVVVVLPFAKLVGSFNISAGRRSLLMAFLLFCVLHNMTETSLFDRDSIVQVFLMLTIALIGEAAAGRAPPNAVGKLRAGAA